MKQVISPLLQIGICTVGYLYATSNVTLAQVKSDGTVNTQVNQNGNVAEITGGETRGSNLFHSFQDFSVSTGNEAFFNNADSISNIFSRVTGGNVSNIDGAIRANGSASLFLINPAGIIFGENARLDIGGSFYGSSASSILFENGEFSAADLNNPPLLTVNAPIGLNLRDLPGNVVNSAVSNNVGLAVNPGETISFAGNEVSFDGGIATAPGGKVEVLGDKVSLINNAAINVSGETGGGTILVGGDYQGVGSLVNASRTYIDDTVTINANAFSNGNGGRVTVWGDEVTVFYGNIFVRGGDVSGNGGFVEVSGKEHLIFRGNVDTTAVNGFTGTLLLDPTNILIANGSGDSAVDGDDTFTGNNSNTAGSILSNPLSEINDDAPTTIFESELEGLSGDTNIMLQATNNITIQDLADDELTLAAGNGVIAFAADADADGIGDFVIEDSNFVLVNEETPLNFADNVDTIKTNGRSLAISGANLTIGNIDTSQVMDSNSGTNGFITLDATNGNIKVVNLDSSDEFRAGGNDITLTATKDINLISNTGNASLTSQPDLGVKTDGGDLIINAGENIVFSSDTDTSDFNFNGSEVSSGNIQIIAEEEITITNSRIGTSIFAFNDEDAKNNAGSISIVSGSTTTLINNSIYTYSVYASRSGDVTITGTSVLLNNTSLNNFADGSQSGNINIHATDGTLELERNRNEFPTTSNTITTGISESIYENDPTRQTGGNITITGNSIVINNYNLDTRVGDDSGFRSNSGLGDGGNITIRGETVKIRNNSNIATETFAIGNAGDVLIEAINSGSFELIDSSITTNSNGAGSAGNTTIDAGSILITKGAKIAAEVGEESFTFDPDITVTDPDNILAGAINFNATENITISNNSEVSASTSTRGIGGNLNVTTPNVLTIQDNSRLGVDSKGEAQAGNITIKANSLNLENNGEISAVTASGRGGLLDINVNNILSLRDSSTISTRAEETGDGGNIDIDTKFVIAYPSGNNDIIADAQQGTGGNININAESLFGIQERALSSQTNDINASSEFSLDGNITITTPDVNPVQGVTELPTNVIAPQETTQQVCQANRESAVNNGLTITGKGGIVAEPGLPLNSLNVTVNGKTNPTSTIPSPMETSQGKIQPARGIKITESGVIILTAYRTNNSGDRIPDSSANCGQI